MKNIPQAYRPSYLWTLWFSPPLILGGSVISAGTIHDLGRVKVPVPAHFKTPALPGSIQGIPQQSGPILFMPPTMTNGPNDIPMPVTPQMILANMNETNQRMQRLELIINDKLSKLDLLDVLNDKLGKFEQNLSNMQTKIGNIKSVQQKQAQTIQNEEKHHHNIEDRIRELELCNRKLEFENYELNENFLEIQIHS
jgi:hypothetical protein